MIVNDKYRIYLKVRSRIQYVLNSSLGIIDPHYRGMILDSIMTILRDCIFTESERGTENE